MTPSQRQRRKVNNCVLQPQISLHFNRIERHCCRHILRRQIINIPLPSKLTINSSSSQCLMITMPSRQLSLRQCVFNNEISPNRGHVMCTTRARYLLPLKLILRFTNQKTRQSIFLTTFYLTCTCPKKFSRIDLIFCMDMYFGSLLSRMTKFF